MVIPIKSLQDLRKGTLSVVVNPEPITELWGPDSPAVSVSSSSLASGGSHQEWVSRPRAKYHQHIERKKVSFAGSGQTQKRIKKEKAVNLF